MPYPKEYVGDYRHLAKWLSSNGFKVYPMEMWCTPVYIYERLILCWDEKHQKEYVIGNERHDLYGLVDVVAWKDGKLWAFEVKHHNDKVKTAILQTQNYARYFDFSCVLAYDLKELIKNRKAFQEMGVGTYYSEKGEIKLLDEPKQQIPEPIEHAKLYERFLRNTGMSTPKPKGPNAFSASQAKVEKYQREQKTLSLFI